MRVRFLQDYRGRPTKEIFYLAGEVAHVTEDGGQVLIDQGRAIKLADNEPDYPEAVTPPAPLPAPEEPGYITPQDAAHNEVIAAKVEEVAETPAPVTKPKARGKK